MSYENEENSVQGGRPYFLYQFSNGVTVERYTSEPDDIIRMNETWTAMPIAHSDLEQSGNIEKQSLEFLMPISDDFARTFLIPIAARITTVTIYRGHHGDVTQEHSVEWKGRVVGTKSTGKRISIVGESIFTSLRQSGCRVRYQVTCRHAVYFGGCRLNMTDFQVPALVTNVTGLVLTLQVPESSVSGFDNDWLAGVVDFNGIYGYVQSQGEDTVTLIQPIEGLADAVEAALEAEEEGVIVMMAPGCRMTKAYCKERFNNNLNFGGFPYIPDANPFMGNIA